MIQELSFEELDLVDGGKMSGANQALIAIGVVALAASGVGLGLAAVYGGASVAGAVGLGAAGIGTGLSAASLGIAIVTSK